MNRKKYGFVLGIINVGFIVAAHAELVWKGSGQVVMMEAESTASQLGEWEKVSDSGNTYLYFTGNKPDTGPPNSPLEYLFTVEREGFYMLHLHCAKQPLREPNGQIRWDCSNDAYVRLEGNFGAGPDWGNDHGDQASLSLLQKDTKLFGGRGDKQFVWTFEGSMDPGGHSNKRQPVYYLKAGETYRLTISGRSQYFRINRIAFRSLSLDFEEMKAATYEESERVPVASVRPVGKNRPVLNAAKKKPAHEGGRKAGSEGTIFTAASCKAKDASEVPFYFDKKREALAIDATKSDYRDTYARAEFKWTGETGTFDLRLDTLGEVDGNSDYRVWVDDQLVGVALNNATRIDYELQQFVFREVVLTKGCTIAVEAAARSNGEIPEGDGYAYARGRWTSISVF